MPCPNCQDFFYKGPRPISLKDFEAVFEITESKDYNLASVGKAHCRHCKHPVAYNYDEVLLIKLTIIDLLHESNQ